MLILASLFLSTPGVVNVKCVSTPSAAASGYVKLFCDSADGHVKSRTNSGTTDLEAAGGSPDIDAVTGQSSWDTAATKKTADLTIDGVEVDFEAGAAEGHLRLPQSTTPPAGDCDAAAEAGRVYFDTDADTDGALYVCTGAAWKLVGGGGSGISYAQMVANNLAGF